VIILFDEMKTTLAETLSYFDFVFRILLKSRHLW